MIRFELPWPDPALAPNRKNGRHWTTVHAIKAHALGAARSIALHEISKSGWISPTGKLGLALTFCAPDKRRRDLDNLLASLKPAFDGISQAIGVDDQFFEPITLKRGEVVKGGCVIVEIGC